jgi:hypothetical protein
MACPECDALERGYRRAVSHIRAIVQGRYSSVPEKLEDLRTWQEKRDLANEQLYLHQSSHSQGRVHKEIA